MRHAAEAASALPDTGEGRQECRGERTRKDAGIECVNRAETASGKRYSRGAC